MSVQTRMDRVARRLGLFGVAMAGLLALAACGGDEPTPVPTSTPSPTVESATSAPIATPDAGELVTHDPDVAFTLIPLINEGAFVDDRDPGGAELNPTLRVPLGSVVQVTLVVHYGGEFDIYFPDFEAKSERVAPGSSTSIVFVADKEGEFVYYSTVPGHREAGLEGRIVVGE